MIKYIITSLFLLFIKIIVFAGTTTSISIAALQTAINTAKSGDTLLLANGTYNNSTLTIAVNNITVMSVTSGAVFLNGTNAITISGNNNRFEGFQFTSGTITGNAITISGNNNTLTQINFNGYNAGHMIYITGQYNILSYSNFQNKPATNLVNHGGTGDMVQIIPNATNIGYNTIRYCSFQHMPGFGGDYGNECIRIGDGVYSTYVSRTVVEYCYFEDTGNGDSESISVKSRENCLRYNTSNNNPNAMFSFRNGDNNIAYGNFFIKSGGIRCKESNNIYCYNNYFGQSGINQNTSLPGTKKAPVYLEYFGAGYGSNFNFINNSFYRGTAIQIDTAIKNCTWANNIFYSDSATIFSGTTAGQTFAGNMYQGTLGITISSGMNKTNPLLMLNAAGYYSISAGSPAIDACVSNYPAILGIPGINDDSTIALDIAGRNRPASILLKDVGADEYTTAVATNHPLSLCETGPTYLCGSVPLTFVSIKAAKTGTNAVEILWETTNETGIKEYIVQQSFDGLTFNNIGKVTAGTNKNSTESFYDYSCFVKKAINYYRIKSIGLQGEIMYSKTVLLNCNTNADGIRIYPNPVKNNTIKIYGKNLLQATVIDLDGRVIADQKINNTNQFDCKINKLKTGIYLLKVTVENGKVYTQKIIVD